MKIDTSISEYRESPSASREFDRVELRHLRVMLRRLHFLEAQVRDNFDPTSPSAIHAERECEALAWLLTDIGFVAETVSSR